MASQEPTTNANESTFKDKLDEVAIGNHVANAKKDQPPGIVDKVVEKVPGASKILGSPNQEEAAPVNNSEQPSPPNRPSHDEHIAEFVRDQHRSKPPQDGASA
ncbi:hypothetical protein F5Y16DRAFT_140937 [Xylariaceae sp. FL0255]|nr:hypothetical protein F5Y16DRAFT_140937 [Xylariaceae sp. FL0255]